MNQKVLDIFQGIVVKLVLYLFKVSAGFPAFLVTQLTEHAYQSFVAPLINSLYLQGQLYYDVEQGHIKLRELNAARKSNDPEKYDAAADDILN